MKSDHTHWKCFEMSKIMLENRKMKVVGNGRGKVKISPKRPYGLPTTLQNKNYAIYHRHPRCWWRWRWSNLLHFGRNLKILRRWAKMGSKTRKWELSEMVGGRSLQVQNMPTDIPKRRRTRFRRYIEPISYNSHFRVFEPIFAQFRRMFRFQVKGGRLQHLHRHQQSRWRRYIA